MSRTTIDFGIDLGTSNSAVAVFSGDRVEIIRNNENSEITPSVVRYLPSGAVQVGQTAYQYLKMPDAAGSTFSRFKRSMGIQEPYLVETTGAEVTPEMLAAELLKSLRQDAESWVSEAVEAAVITVPAMFELAQCEATIRAAAMAGIRQAPLLQEPIAAGLAYGYDNNAGDGYFLVYDIGSGTFDISLLRIEAGRLAVVGTEGDNYLGGSDWDLRLANAIVERLIDQGYELWDVTDPDGHEFRSRMKFVAEQEKIQLSRRDHVEVFLDGTLHDMEGDPIETSLTIKRSEYEVLISDDIERSVVLVSRLLETYGMPANQIRNIVLVGGPTKTPLLRSMLSSSFVIPLETRLDPMTVVASGAARFASTTQIEESKTSIPVSVDTLKVSLVYPPASEDVVVPIGGRFETAPAGLVIEVRRADGGWMSGRIPVQNGIFQTSVPLVQGRGNVFGLTATGAQGQRFLLDPERFTITQGLVVAPPPLARSIAVVAWDAAGREVQHTLLERNQPLPAVSPKYVFRSTRAVRAGHSEDVLAIHVVEGEYDRRELNRPVGRVLIHGGQLQRDLPKDTIVELSLAIDQSRAVKVSAYLPLLDVLIAEVLQDKAQIQEDADEVRERLDNELERIAKISEFSTAGLHEISGLARQIEEDLDAADGGDIERSNRAATNWKELSARIDKYESDVELQHVSATLQDMLARTQQLATDQGDADQLERMRLLRIESEGALDKQDIAAMQQARADLDSLHWEMLSQHPDFWKWMFDDLSRRMSFQVATPESQILLQHGRSALLKGDIAQLREICYQLWDLMPSSETGENTLQDVGIRIYH